MLCCEHLQKFGDVPLFHFQYQHQPLILLKQQPLRIHWPIFLLQLLVQILKQALNDFWGVFCDVCYAYGGKLPQLQVKETIQQ